jgi:GTPase Era involved in 16S rRNA processing
MFQVLEELLSYCQNRQRIIKDQLTDKPGRFFVNETIRENIIELQQRNPMR